MPASILPNGKNQFEDINGKPLVGGTVSMYIPSDTLVPKDTWQDPLKAILNTNPIVLDSRGQCVIYGDGAYRQRVKDSLGNLIWDELTASPYTPINPPPSVTSFYDFPVYIEGKPTDAELYPIFNIVRDVSLPIALIGSLFTMATLPTDSFPITLNKNGTPIGTVTFSTIGVPVSSFTSVVTFTATDQFSLTFPTPQDATGADIALTFVFTVIG